MYVFLNTPTNIPFYVTEHNLELFVVELSVAINVSQSERAFQLIENVERYQFFNLLITTITYHYYYYYYYIFYLTFDETVVQCAARSRWVRVLPRRTGPRGISFNKIFASTYLGQLGLPSSEVDKSSTSFGWGYGGTSILPGGSVISYDT